MRPICVVYHCLFFAGDPPQLLPSAIPVVSEQMKQLQESGLLAMATEFLVGVNGGEESRELAERLLPDTAKITYHGLESRAENLTIVMLEEWVKYHPPCHVLYFHAKGSTHAPGSDYGENVSKPWRQTMMLDLVMNWHLCVDFLLSGFDIVCSRWLWNMADGTQHIPAGNFLWIDSEFAKCLPSIYQRERIKVSGIGAAESRYEAEVYWGNGPRPNVKALRVRSGGGLP